MKDKTKNIIIIILVIIIAILCGVIGWVLGTKFADRKNDIIEEKIDEVIENQEKEELEEVANNLLSRISGLYMCGEPELDLGSDNKLTYEELDKDYVNRFVIGSLFLNKKVTDLEDSKYSVSVDEFKNEFIKTFGNKADFELPQTFYISYIKFDLVEDNYIGSTMAMGCTRPSGKYILNEYKKDNNKISLIVSLVFEISENEYVTDPTIGFPIEEEIETYTEEEIKNYTGEIIYTFILENDNYIFESIERA